ncbi:hypothetical protein KA478_04185 [Patescibacteria group bacterium]|nr:hypothetical protein [Patescibacteria group bacterium]
MKKDTIIYSILILWAVGLIVFGFYNLKEQYKQEGKGEKEEGEEKKN